MMNKNIFNAEMTKHIEMNQNKISPNVLDFLRNSKIEKVEKDAAYDSFQPYSPYDYSVSLWYKDKLSYISFMHQCEPNSDLPLDGDELFEVFEIYSFLGFEGLA